jgi:hypothetical protein
VEFLVALDRFGQAILKGIEVDALKDLPTADQVTILRFRARQRWGQEPEKSSDPIAREMMSILLVLRRISRMRLP